MKIVCIAASFVPSNTANSIQVMKVCHAMKELGHDITLVVPGDKAVPWMDLQDHYGLQQAFNIHWIPENLAFRRYDFAIKALQTARRMAPDMIYTWVLQAAVLAVWLRLPTILEMHDRVTGKFGPWLFQRFLKSRTKKRLLPITDALKRLLISDYNLHEEHIEIVIAPDGVDLNRYQDLPSPEEARRQLGLREGYTAGYSGHFYAGRGMELLYRLAKSLPEMQFLWVGGNPEDVAQWQKRMEGEGIQNITLTGFMQNALLPQYQAAADVLMMPYQIKISGSGGGNTAQIASPMKMFEYMAAGRAIISSDLPVIHEVLNDQTAIFCNPEDFNDWRAALLALQSDPARREQLAQNVRTLAKSYSWCARTERALQGYAETE